MKYDYCSVQNGNVKKLFINFIENVIELFLDSNFNKKICIFSVSALRLQVHLLRASWKSYTLSQKGTMNTSQKWTILKKLKYYGTDSSNVSNANFNFFPAGGCSTQWGVLINATALQHFSLTAITLRSCADTSLLINVSSATN